MDFKYKVFTKSKKNKIVPRKIFKKIISKEINRHHIGVFGLWHLGTVISAVWSKIGFNVVGFDYDKKRIENLQKGILPVYEPRLQETLNNSFKKKKLLFSSNIESLSECEYIFLSYDTPVTNDDSSNTDILEKSVIDISRVMKDEAVIIVSSQSPVGYCSLLRKKLKENNNTLELAYSPENLRLGEALYCYLNPGRIIIGTADKNTENKCIKLFNNITNEIFTMNLESAEMVKHGINSFLAMSIVFANNLADICEEKNANIDDVVMGMKSDLRIGQKAYLSPGIGFSGGTLGRDLKVLDVINKKSKGYAKLFGAIYDYNNKRKYSIVNRIRKLTNGFFKKNIGILGITYKPGTSTLRRSRPLEIVNFLIKEGANIRVYDPMADYSELNGKPKFTVSENIEDLAKDLDILVLFTEWIEFKEFRWETVIDKMRNKIFYDTKNFMNKSRLKTIGFKYYSIGRI